MNTILVLLSYIPLSLSVTTTTTIYYPPVFSPTDKVVVLNETNFNSTVIDSDDLWLVMFYANWCTKCHEMADEWKKGAASLKGITNVGVVNVDENKSFRSRYNLKGVPVLKIFGSNKKKPNDYWGYRTAISMIDVALTDSKKMALKKSNCTIKKETG